MVEWCNATETQSAVSAYIYRPVTKPGARALEQLVACIYLGSGVANDFARVTSLMAAETHDGCAVRATPAACLCLQLQVMPLDIK